MATEISKQLDRIESAVSDIKAAIVNQGVTVPSETKIGGLAPLVSSISSQPKLQDKTVNPDYTTKTVSADSGYDGLGTVTVTKIPLSYADTSSGDAVASEILKNKKAWVDGSEVTGTMPVNEGVAIYLGNSEDGFISSYDIPDGYHDGKGAVYIYYETKTATPTDKKQEFTPSFGSAFSKLTVNPIPSKYKDVTGANATPSQVIEGSKFVGANGTVETGTMPIYEDSSAYLYENGMDDEGNYHWGCQFDRNVIIPAGESSFKIPASEFGNANQMYVAEGSTFTSENGVCLEGTMPVYDYSYVGAEYSDETDEGFVFYGTLNGGAGAFVADDINLEVPKEQFGDASASHVLQGKTFTSVDGWQVEGTMPNVSLNPPTFTVQLDDERDNAIWLQATASQSTGYTEGGRRSNDTYSILTVSGDTATMECGDVTITRKVTDANLKAENIKKGVTIFGIVGTYEGGSEVVLPSMDVRIIDNDWCGPYGITYTNSNGGQVTQTVECGGDITITALSGTIVHISADSSGGYSGAVLEDESGTRFDTCSWNEYEIQLPSNGTSYMLYIFG